MLIFNDLLQLINKNKKINIAEKKNTLYKIFLINFTKKMSIDALIERIQHKFIINFY